MTDTSFFGHPRGLRTLFFTELWERWGYYGMRSLLILFMTAKVADGGMGFDVAAAGSIYGIYAAMIYMWSLPGGWIADRFLGQQRTVLYAAFVMTIGYFLLAVDSTAVFYLALVLLVFGTGFLKPNISTIVGQLYEEDDPRRDAGFSIFYMGINLGASVSPLVCGWIALHYGFRAGMASAGVGMAIGFLQFLLGGKALGEAGKHPVQVSKEDDAQARGLLYKSIAALTLLALAVAGLTASGILTLTVEGISQAAGVTLTVITIGLFAWMLLAGNWTPSERGRIYVIAVLFVASMLFWSVFEQAGSTLNLFAARSTDTTIFGWEYPPSWFQSINGVMIVLLAPVFAWMWLKMGPRNPSSVFKFSLGLIQVGLGFIVLVGGAVLAQGGSKVSPMWLIATYLLHTTGELCLSPVGLSAFTKLAPARVAGFMMGVWFLSISLGNFVGGQIASFYDALPLPQLLTVVGGFAIGAGVILALFTKPIVRLMGEK